MYIFVDESGTFTAPASAAVDSWCVVAAYVSPETDQQRLTAIVAQLHQDCGGLTEVKINQLSEARYIRFLRDVGRLTGLLFMVAVDVSLHSEMAIKVHRDAQADMVVEHQSKMIHAEGRQSLIQLSDLIRSLPIQLYTQLTCQAELFHKVLVRAPVYYSQHKPETLANLSWRVDKKNTGPTDYERAFHTVLPAFLQSRSLREPMIRLVEGNYDYLRRFEFADGKYPTYLEKDYGIKTSGRGLNVGQMVKEDFKLVDSKMVPGVQVADLFASGLSRLLRGKIERSHEVALGIGGSMLSELNGEPQVRLISLSRSASVSDRTADLLKLLARKAKPIIT